MTGTYDNLILVGMPGAGKSTLGVLLAKALGMAFLDTDLVLQTREGGLLREIMAREGTEGFLRAEEAAVCSLTVHRTVIATGGSVIYSPRAMAHLRAGGPVICLLTPLEALRERIPDPVARGIVLRQGSTLDDLFRERMPLYRQYGEITVDCGQRTMAENLEEILRGLSAWGAAEKGGMPPAGKQN